MKIKRLAQVLVIITCLMIVSLVLFGENKGRQNELEEIEVKLPDEIVYCSGLSRSDDGNLFVVACNQNNEQILFKYIIKTGEWKELYNVSSKLKERCDNIEEAEIIPNVSPDGRIFCIVHFWGDSNELISAYCYYISNENVITANIDAQDLLYTADLGADDYIVLGDISGNVYQYSVEKNEITNMYYNASDGYADHFFLDDNDLYIVTFSGLEIRDIETAGVIEGTKETSYFKQKYKFDCDSKPTRDFCIYDKMIFCMDEKGITQYTEGKKVTLISNKNYGHEDAILEDFICVDNGVFCANFNLEDKGELYLYR